MTKSTIAWVCGSVAFGMVVSIALVRHPASVAPVPASPADALLPPTANQSPPAPVASRPLLANLIARIPPGPLGRFVHPGSLTDRLPATFPSEVVAVHESLEREAVEGVLLDRQDDDAIRNEAANLLRRSEDPQLAQLLIEILNCAEETERFRAFAAQHLGRLLDAPADSFSIVRDRLRAALKDSHQAVRREALLALVHGHDSGGVDAFHAAWDDPSWNPSRGLLIRIAYELDCRDLSPAIRLALKSSEEDQQIAALYVLGQWGDRASLGAMEQAAADPSQRVRVAASEAVQRCRTAPGADSSSPP